MTNGMHCSLSVVCFLADRKLIGLVFLNNFHVIFFAPVVVLISHGMARKLFSRRYYSLLEMCMVLLGL